MDVEESKDGTTLTIRSDKRVNAFVIYKPENGYAMFKIKYEGSGQVPAELSGAYTSRTSALKDLTFWIKHNEPTKEKVWEDKYKDSPPPELKTKPIKREA